MTAIHTTMKDGRALCLRPLKDDDASLIEAGIAALSDRSRYLRFFSMFKTAPQTVIDRLTDFDEDHLAWGAVDYSLPDKPSIAAAHIIHLDTMPDATGEFAIAVLDDYHDLGIARALASCLFQDAREQGFERIVLDVLAENAYGLSFFRWLGSRTVSRHGHIIQMELGLDRAIDKLGGVQTP